MKRFLPDARAPTAGWRPTSEGDSGFESCFWGTRPSAEAALVRGWEVGPQPCELTKETQIFPNLTSELEIRPWSLLPEFPSLCLAWSVLERIFDPKTCLFVQKCREHVCTQGSCHLHGDPSKASLSPPGLAHLTHPCRVACRRPPQLLQQRAGQETPAPKAPSAPFDQVGREQGL